MENSNINKIREFINNNIKLYNSTMKENGFNKLVEFIDDNNVILSLEEANDLLMHSNKLLEVIKYIKEKEISTIFSDSIENIFLAYDLNFEEDDIKTLTKIKGTKHKNDLDTMGLYLSSLPSVFTEDEEKEVLDLIKKGNLDAKNKMIEHNLKLVVSIAKRYATPQANLNDLIQEGNIGLMIAVDRFDSSIGCKFSTYATWWIRQRITRYIADNSRTVRVPVYMHELIYKMNRISDKLESSLNRKPTLKELSVEMDVPISKMYAIEKYSAMPVSLDLTIGKSSSEEDKTELNEFVKDENSEFESEILDVLFYEELRKSIFESDIIKPQAKKVLYYRYGFYNGNPMTLEEVGNIMGVTRERVRQIEKKALISLSNSAKMKGFKPEMSSDSKYKKQENNRNFVLSL